MPDAPGLELIRGEIEQDHPGAVLDTSFDRDQPALVVDPAQILAVLVWLHDAPGQNYRFLSSLHAADYLPAQPRFGVHYELLNRDRVERLRVKAMLGDPRAAGPVTAGDPPPLPVAKASSGEVPPTAPPAAEALPEIDSCVELFPTAEFQEREAYDFFGIVFRGHPDLTRILLPEDYVGWPQRRDFPVGGEPVTFTYNERLYG
ncbi:MAG TPA: NADH-quinone oxidoreductase subunit C [Solirubrobacterales bacterium]|nr:NADH-quinone oxidoreductase subunit C [Solirubrobacterales bacterium]